LSLESDCLRPRKQETSKLATSSENSCGGVLDFLGLDLVLTVIS